MIEGRLTASPYTRGRYIVHTKDNDDGPELTSGQAIMLKLGGHWIAGYIEHGGTLYASDTSPHIERGYYFIADDGSVCGLCVGMTVRA